MLISFILNNNGFKRWNEWGEDPLQGGANWITDEFSCTQIDGEANYKDVEEAVKFFLVNYMEVPAWLCNLFKYPRARSQGMLYLNLNLLNYTSDSTKPDRTIRDVSSKVKSAARLCGRLIQLISRTKGLRVFCDKEQGTIALHEATHIVFPQDQSQAGRRPASSYEQEAAGSAKRRRTTPQTTQLMGPQFMASRYSVAPDEMEAYPIVQSKKRKPNLTQCSRPAIDIAPVGPNYYMAAMQQHDDIKTIAAASQRASESLECSITHAPAENPVILNGRIYEKDAIAEWVREHKTDPFTNEVVALTDITVAPQIAECTNTLKPMAVMVPQNTDELACRYVDGRIQTEEAKRVAAEQQRDAAEQQRDAAKQQRDVAEQQKVAAENEADRIRQEIFSLEQSLNNNQQAYATLKVKLDEKIDKIRTLKTAGKELLVTNNSLEQGKLVLEKALRDKTQEIRRERRACESLKGELEQLKRRKEAAILALNGKLAF